MLLLRKPEPKIKPGSNLPKIASHQKTQNMKNYEILEVFWTNNWSESGEYITMSFASEEEARKWCDTNSSIVEEEFPQGSNSYYKDGLEYRLTTPSC